MKLSRLPVTISMAGRALLKRWQPPRGERHLVVVPPRRAPALHIMNARCYDAAEARRQSLAITPAMVSATAERLLQRLTADRADGPSHR